ncbi:MAG: PPOX class F420-dependent oxidoreductase [Dehalococcoidia bacterium]
MTMEPSEIYEFLRGKRIAVLATIGKGGAPHLTSMWYAYENESITFWPGADAVKVKNIRRDDRVSVLVDVHQEPYKGVRIDGTAVVEEANVRDRAYVIARRYLGHKEGTEYVDQYGDGLGVIIKVTPRRFYTWDYSKP